MQNVHSGAGRLLAQLTPCIQENKTMSRAARNAIIEPMQTGIQGAEEWSVTIATCVLSPHSATKTAMKTRRTISCAPYQVEKAC